MIEIKIDQAHEGHIIELIVNTLKQNPIIIDNILTSMLNNELFREFLKTKIDTSFPTAAGPAFEKYFNENKSFFEGTINTIISDFNIPEFVKQKINEQLHTDYSQTTVRDIIKEYIYEVIQDIYGSEAVTNIIQEICRSEETQRSVSDVVRNALQENRTRIDALIIDAIRNNRDFETIISDTIDAELRNHNIDDAITDSISNAIDESSITDSIREAVDEHINERDIQDSVREIIDEKVDETIDDRFMERHAGQTIEDRVDDKIDDNIRDYLSDNPDAITTALNRSVDNIVSSEPSLGLKQFIETKVREVVLSLPIDDQLKNKVKEILSQIDIQPAPEVIPPPESEYQNIEVHMKCKLTDMDTLKKLLYMFDQNTTVTS